METTSMADSTMGTRVSLPNSSDPTRDNVFKSVDDSMANFFSRPILATTYTWTPLQVTPFGATLNPWSLFFQNPRVINRLNNYMLMRANVHVRFLINGNGFYYGRLMADYNPLFGNDNVTNVTTSNPLNAVAASQRMKVFIDPSDCCSNEMELPFVWAKDAISPVGSEWASLGQINIRELCGLKHANGATQPVTISVFVWATNVQYAVPTSVPSSTLVAQAGDEYGAGPVENIATAIGGAASTMASLPVVGKYARATQLAAGAAAKVARAVGWSRPAVIDPLMGMRPTFISSLAPADAGDSVTKLSVDSKQEVSVDPSVIGIDLVDELSVAAIAARESYLTTFTWTTANTAGDHLYNLRVKPSLCRFANPFFFAPACSVAEMPFSYWRGKMRFRFQVVASAYHKGRLRIVYDPSYIASLEANVQYTRVVDISTERDVTVEVDWAQTAHYLSTGSLATGWTAHSATAFATPSTNSNGVLGLYVLNDLATPNSTVNNDIQINVYVSMVDFEGAAPRDTSPWGSTFTTTVQAGEMLEDPGSGNEPGCGVAVAEHQIGNAPIDAHDADVYFGEVITSFRQLLRRYTFDFSFYASQTSTTSPSLLVAYFPDSPVPLGYNSSTFHTSTAGKKFNYVNNSLYRLLAPCFVASRGSQRVKYVASSSATGRVMAITANRGEPQAIQLPGAVLPMPTTSNSNYARAVYGARRSLMQGAVVTPVSNQPVLEFEIPYYKAVRFDETRIQDMANTSPTSPFSGSHRLDLLAGPAAVNPEVTIVDRYTAVGEDFSFMWWQGCPPIAGVSGPA